MSFRRIPVILVMGSLLIVGCGDGDSEDSATTIAAAATTTTTTNADSVAESTTTTTTPPTTTSVAAPGNCGTPDEPTNEVPDLSAVTISFTPTANLQVIGDVCDNDGEVVNATVDNGSGFVANYVVDETGQFTSSTAGMGHLGYNEPTFVPAGSQITVTVSVTDDAGGVGTKVANLTVPVANALPEFDYSKAVRNGYIVDVQGEAFDTDGEIVSVMVNWGDGAVDTYTEFEPGLLPNGVELDGVHQYDPDSADGKQYFVTITVTDNRGSTASMSHQVEF